MLDMPIVVGYTTDIVGEYGAALDACETEAALRGCLARWRVFAADAVEQVEGDGFAWDEFVAGLRLERQGKFAGEAWGGKYCALVMPAMLVWLGLNADYFRVPTGLYFLRAVEDGVLIRDDQGIFLLRQDAAGASDA